jgi:putative endonuclease
MTACCYILLCADGTLYTGWTSDLTRRLKQHNAGSGSRYTRARRPVALYYSEPQPDSLAARRREIAIKRMSRAAKLALSTKKPGVRKTKSRKSSSAARP